MGVSLGQFLPNFHRFGQHHVRSFVKIWADSLKGFVHYPKFSTPPAAKLWVGGEHVLEMQERYGPPLSPCQVWWGSDIARRHELKSSIFFFVFLFVRHAFE